MRGSIVFSSTVHLLLFLGLVVVRPTRSLVVPGPDVVQVALVDPTAVATPVAPEVRAPEPKPEPLPEVKPVEDTGVKIAPPKLRPKKEEKKTETPPPPAVTPTLPSAAMGPAGLKGDAAVDASNFEYTYYLVLIRNRIAANWTPPAGLSTGGNPVRAVVYFRVGRGGEITGVRMESASGLEFFDRSALRAVTLSDPLPPLPLGFSSGDLGVHFGFDWESP